MTDRDGNKERERDRARVRALKLWCAFDLVGRRGVCVILIDFELQTINAVASR